MSGCKSSEYITIKFTKLEAEIIKAILKKESEENTDMRIRQCITRIQWKMNQGGRNEWKSI